MDYLTQAIVVFFSVSLAVMACLGVVMFIGRRNRLQVKKMIEESKAKLESDRHISDMKASFGDPPIPIKPVTPPFDPTNILEAIRVVTEACTAQGQVLEQHERHLQHHQQALVSHDNALVDFQRKEAISAHAIAMLQEGHRDLTAMTSQGLPSGKMFPSVNSFLERKRPIPTVPLPKPDEDDMIIDPPDFVPPDDEPAPPTIPPPYPPPARPEPEAGPKPKRSRKKP